MPLYTLYCFSLALLQAPPSFQCCNVPFFCLVCTIATNGKWPGGRGYVVASAVLQSMFQEATPSDLVMVVMVYLVMVVKVTSSLLMTVRYSMDIHVCIIYIYFFA